MTSSILGPNGSRLVEMGGERAWRVRTKGDIVVSFQWLDIGGEEPEACMCLFPALRRMETGAYVIPQANAYAYATRDGGATEQHVGLAFKAAIHMGFFPDKSTIQRIMDAVVENIPDLIEMPSEQPGALNIKRAVMGIEATASVNGRTIVSEVL